MSPQRFNYGMRLRRSSQGGADTATVLPPYTDRRRGRPPVPSVVNILDQFGVTLIGSAGSSERYSAPEADGDGSVLLLRIYPHVSGAGAVS
jgi:hypothetical protein